VTGSVMAMRDYGSPMKSSNGWCLPFLMALTVDVRVKDMVKG